jgi:hypothetical protein
MFTTPTIKWMKRYTLALTVLCTSIIISTKASVPNEQIATKLQVVGNIHTLAIAASVLKKQEIPTPTCETLYPTIVGTKNESTLHIARMNKNLCIQFILLNPP